MYQHNSRNVSGRETASHCLTKAANISTQEPLELDQPHAHSFLLEQGQWIEIPREPSIF